jgi:hypothetical protein
MAAQKVFAFFFLAQHSLVRIGHSPHQGPFQQPPAPPLSPASFLVAALPAWCNPPTEPETYGESRRSFCAVICWQRNCGSWQGKCGGGALVTGLGSRQALLASTKFGSGIGTSETAICTAVNNSCDRAGSRYFLLFLAKLKTGVRVG